MAAIMARFRLGCGHTLRIPDTIPVERDREQVRCPRCGTLYLLFGFGCGHAFAATPRDAAQWVACGVESVRDGPCLECMTVHVAPHPVRCERCARRFTLRQEGGAVCDRCLPQATLDSLSSIAGMLAEEALAQGRAKEQELIDLLKQVPSTLPVYDDLMDRLEKVQKVIHQVIGQLAAQGR